MCIESNELLYIFYGEALAEINVSQLLHVLQCVTQEDGKQTETSHKNQRHTQKHSKAKHQETSA